MVLAVIELEVDCKANVVAIRVFEAECFIVEVEFMG